jgi:hypothetical protein
MRKQAVSSTDLAYIFTERLKEFGDCAPTISIAIVPTADGWQAVTNNWARFKNPRCAKRIEQVQKELQKTYAVKA